MKMKKRRFSSPTVLTDDMEVLGATVKQWDDALTGNFQKSLEEIKKRVMNLESKPAHPLRRVEKDR